MVTDFGTQNRNPFQPNAELSSCARGANGAPIYVFKKVTVLCSQKQKFNITQCAAELLRVSCKREADEATNGASVAQFS